VKYINIYVDVEKMNWGWYSGLRPRACHYSMKIRVSRDYLKKNCHYIRYKVQNPIVVICFYILYLTSYVTTMSLLLLSLLIPNHINSATHYMSLPLITINSWNLVFESRGDHSLLYLHTRAFGTYLLGGYLPCKKDYKVIVFYM
jgi:hypothetical protein